MTLRDQLEREWRSLRNPRALQTLLDSLGDELPSRVVRRERDRRLRELAAPLLAHGYSHRRSAAIVAELGAATECGRPPRLDGVDPGLIVELAASQREAGRMLRWLPPRADGHRWPSRAQIRRIILGS